MGGIQAPTWNNSAEIASWSIWVIVERSQDWTSRVNNIFRSFLSEKLFATLATHTMVVFARCPCWNYVTDNFRIVQTKTTHNTHNTHHTTNSTPQTTHIKQHTTNHNQRIPTNKQRTTNTKQHKTQNKRQTLNTKQHTLHTTENTTNHKQQTRNNKTTN